jgi:diaminopropionate ammonia-lyase
LPVEVVVPAVISRRAETAIAAEGARVTRIAGNYDEAVAAAAELADRMPSAVLVQDTGWNGYEVVPGWIVEGYQTLLSELDDQLADLGVGGPDMIAVPVGVGSLAQAVVAAARGRSDDAWVRAALAGATACLDDPARRAELDLRNDAVVVLLNTEGAGGADGAP